MSNQPQEEMLKHVNSDAKTIFSLPLTFNLDNFHPTMTIVTDFYSIKLIKTHPQYSPQLQLYSQ